MSWKDRLSFSLAPFIDNGKTLVLSRLGKLAMKDSRGNDSTFFLLFVGGKDLRSDAERVGNVDVLKLGEVELERSGEDMYC